MHIKNVVIDKIHYNDFITFNISTLFFLDLPSWNWGASYIPVSLICRQIVMQFYFSNLVISQIEISTDYMWNGEWLSNKKENSFGYNL